MTYPRASKNERIHWRLVLCLLIFLSGCASITQKLKEDFDGGKHERVVARSETWLENNQSLDLDSEERQEVERYKAKSELELVRKENTLPAYQSFNKRWRRVSHLNDIVQIAFELESVFYFTDQTKKQHSIEGYRDFQKLYPLSSKVSESRSAQSELAYAAAHSAGSVASFEAFRLEYEPWEEGSKWIVQARTQEVELAYEMALESELSSSLVRFRESYEQWPEFKKYRKTVHSKEFQFALKETRALGSLEAVKAFRQEYGGWDGFESEIRAIRELELSMALEEAELQGIPALKAYQQEYGSWPDATEFLNNAFQQEASLALKLAVEAHDLESISAFRAEYDLEPWKTKADGAEANLVLEPVLSAVSAGAIFSFEKVTGWIRKYAKLEHVTAAAKPFESKVWKWAGRTEAASSYRLFAGMFPDSKRRANALKIEADIAWNNAVNASDARELQVFANRYYTDQRADEAEQLFYRRRKSSVMEGWAPTADITARFKSNRTGTDLYVDVTGCNRQRVSGLQGANFEVYSNGENVKLLKFAGLEDAYPVDIVFQIDLSGSMRTEINAVKRAVNAFAEVFKFRNRKVRLGLVTFSDFVDEVIPLTSNIRKFQSLVNRATDELGGGVDAEDSVHALAKAAALFSGKKAERVTITITDEDLQINAGGRTELGIRMKDANCRVIAAVVDCMEKCKADIPCRNECAGHLSGSIRRKMVQCNQRYNDYYCGGVLSREIRHTIAACGSQLSENSKEMKAVVKKLSKSRMRPFFVTAAGSNSGFRSLARMTQGAVYEVSDDTRVEGPYIEKLMDIAEQLSRQYTLTIKTTRRVQQRNLDILVRPSYLWVTQGAAIANNIADVYLAPDSPASHPLFWIVTSDGVVHEGGGDGSVWADLYSTHSVDVVAETVMAKDSLYLLDAKGKVFKYRSGMVSPVSVETAVHQATAISIAPGGAAVSGYGTDKGWIISNAAENPSTALMRIPAGQLESGTTPLPLIHPEGTICSLLQSGRLACLEDNTSNTMLDVAGLHKDTLSTVDRVYPVAGHPHVFLLLTHSGEMFRTLNNGRTWKMVLDAVGERRTIVAVEGPMPMICAATSQRIMCSDDAGRSWFKLGRRFDSNGKANLVASGSKLFAVQNGSIQRLNRIVNREVPSTSIFFASKSTVPNSSMEPFIASIVKRMESDPELKLRIEGHSDSRGSNVDNQTLAANRAKAIVDIISNAGVLKHRISSISFGENRPIRKEKTNSDMARNRRVELLLVRDDAHLAAIPSCAP